MCWYAIKQRNQTNQFNLWSHTPKIDELKVYIWHAMLSEKQWCATETTKKISCVYGEGVITDHWVRNWFSKLFSGDMSLRNEPSPERSSDLHKNALKELMEYNAVQRPRELSLKHLNT